MAESNYFLNNPITPPPATFVAVPDGITPDQAQQYLQELVLRGPSTPAVTNKRKRRRAMTQESDMEEETEAFGYGASHWRMLASEARICWARWFSLPDEKYVNDIMVKAFGSEILEKGNHLAYDIGYEKVRAWGRQWQCDILRRLVKHVSQESSSNLLPN